MAALATLCVMAGGAAAPPPPVWGQATPGAASAPSAAGAGIEVRLTPYQAVASGHEVGLVVEERNALAATIRAEIAASMHHEWVIGNANRERAGVQPNPCPTYTEPPVTPQAGTVRPPGPPPRRKRSIYSGEAR